MAQSILEEVDADAQAHEVQRRERGGKDLVGRRSEVVGAGVPAIREVRNYPFALLTEPVDLGSHLFEGGPSSIEVLNVQVTRIQTKSGERRRARRTLRRKRRKLSKVFTSNLISRLCYIVVPRRVV